MANGYGGAGASELASGESRKINFNWFGEAWKLFVANAATWVPAVAITYYGPGAVFAFILIATHATRLVGAHVSHPSALMFGVTLITLVFSAYMLNGLGNLAVKQAGGASTSFGDIFSGSHNFTGVLGWIILCGLAIDIGSLFVIVGGVFVAALLLPSFAMVASGTSLFEAISKSINVTKNDRGSAMGMAFVLGLMLLGGGLFFGLGLLITVPIVLLVSALSYRDLIGLPGLPQISNVPDIQLIDTDNSGPRVSLTGEPLDETENVL